MILGIIASGQLRYVGGGGGGGGGNANIQAFDLYGWGYDYEFELANASLGEGYTYTPSQIDSPNQYRMVSCTKDGFVLAIRDDGTLWTWGYNAEGFSYDPPDSYNESPVQIGSASNWVWVSTGGFQGHAINEDGEMYALGGQGWGEGAIGNVSTQPGLTPTPVSESGPWRYSDASRGMTAAIKQDGTLWTAGLNAYSGARLGVPSLNGFDSNAFVQVGTDNDWSLVSLSQTFALGIKTNGELYGWGNGSDYVFGNNSLDNILTPNVRIGTDTWKCVATGGVYSIGINTAGYLHTWGTTLDANDYSVNTVPTLSFSANNDWVKVAVTNRGDISGWISGFALNSSGNLYSWGYSEAAGQGSDFAPSFYATFDQISGTWANVYGGGSYTAFGLKV